MITESELEKIKEDEFLNGFNEGKEFFADYIANWMESTECSSHMTPEGMEILREKVLDFNNGD
jgi:hypothetical protein